MDTLNLAGGKNPERAICPLLTLWLLQGKMINNILDLITQTQKKENK